MNEDRRRRWRTRGANLLDWLEAHLAFVFVVILPGVVIVGLFGLPIGNYAGLDCSGGPFLLSCTSMHAGSSLYEYATATLGGSLVDLGALAFTLGVSVTGAVLVWVVSSQWSKNRGYTFWAAFSGAVLTLGPGLGLDPAWGYWLIIGSFWIALGSAYIYREGIDVYGNRQEGTFESLEYGYSEHPPRNPPPPNYHAPPPPTPDAQPSPPPPPAYVIEAYHTLNLQPGATRTEVMGAYKRLAKKYHPDLNKSRGATSRMKRINSAKDTLQDYLKGPG